MIFRKSNIALWLGSGKVHTFTFVSINLIYEKHIHHLMVYQFVDRVVNSGIIVRVDTKIKRKYDKQPRLAET
jgi:hypothetical protein